MIKWLVKCLTLAIFICHLENLVLFIFQKYFLYRWFVFVRKYLIHAVWHNVIERIDDIAVIGYWVVIIEPSDFGIELTDYFQVIQVQHVRSDDGFPNLFAIDDRDSCGFIIKEFLPHRFKIQVQYRLVSECTNRFTVLILT